MLAINGLFSKIISLTIEIYFLTICFLEISSESLLLYLLQCFENYTQGFFHDDKLSDIPPLLSNIFKKDFLVYMAEEQYALFLESIKHIVIKFENNTL